MQDTDASVVSNASAVDSMTAIGAAVAINVADSFAAAMLAGTVSAGDVVVEALMSGGGTSTFAAEALSGAGATDVGVAGSLALNIVDTSNEALIKAGATVMLTSSDVVLSATNVTNNTAAAGATVQGEPVGTPPIRRTGR